MGWVKEVHRRNGSMLSFPFMMGHPAIQIISFPGFTPFSYEEIERFIGLYMLQGLNPSPQVEWKFSSQRTNPINGSDLCNHVFGKNAFKQHRQFKSFFVSRIQANRHLKENTDHYTRLRLSWPMYK